MPFPHEDPDFRDLLEAAARPVRLPAALVEKDYWVSHALWAIQQAGFELWFKGGTSLSKGFQLIERFSEDLDVKLARADLPEVSNWRSETRSRVEEREAFFRALGQVLPALSTDGTLLDEEQLDPRWRSANYHMHYPGLLRSEIGGANRAYVLLEVGHARVMPYVERDLTSFVHSFLASQDHLEDYDDNQPRAVRCVHPWVTLWEKLEAISRRFEAGHDPAGYARHYEDAARIVRGELPALGMTPAELRRDLEGSKDLRRALSSADPAFFPSSGMAWQRVERAYLEIAHMFWGERTRLEEACSTIRQWLEGNAES